MTYRDTHKVQIPHDGDELSTQVLAPLIGKLMERLELCVVGVTGLEQGGAQGGGHGPHRVVGQGRVHALKATTCQAAKLTVEIISGLEGIVWMKSMKFEGDCLAVVGMELGAFL